jgi:dimethylaniline monooxygenase (N-oxide forming)
MLEQKQGYFVNEKPTNRVCIVGAGVAGIVTAKVLSDDGFEVTVYEKENDPGGVWAPSRAYPGLRANNPGQSYAFSDHPYTADADVFPTADQVRNYLRTYIDRFNLRRLINVNVEVVSVRYKATRQDTKGSYELVLKSSGGVQIEQFDFVVICNGIYSQPYIPDIRDSDRFKVSCTRFRRHQVRCFMEQEVRHGEKAVYAGVQA